jgi:hypothetical protein
MSVDVTNGNTIVVTGTSFNSAGAGGSFVITKTAGTATLGTPVKDAENSVLSGHLKQQIWRVPVTGSGSLTLLADPSSDLGFAGAAEYSNFNASPLDGSPVTNTGSTEAESSGAVGAHAGGVVVSLLNEDSSGVLTYTAASDSLIFSQNNGTGFITGYVQYKLIGSDSSPALTVDCGVNLNWFGLAVAYLPATGATTVPTAGVAIAIARALATLRIRQLAQYVKVLIKL